MAIRMTLYRSVPPTVALLRTLRFVDGASLHPGNVLRVERWPGLAGFAPFFTPAHPIRPERVVVMWKGQRRVLRLGIDARVLTPAGLSATLDLLVPEHWAPDCQCGPDTCDLLERAVAYVVYGGRWPGPHEPRTLSLSRDVRALARGMGGQVNWAASFHCPSDPVARLDQVVGEVAQVAKEGWVRSDAACERLRVAAGWWTARHRRPEIAELVHRAFEGAARPFA